MYACNHIMSIKDYIRVKQTKMCARVMNLVTHDGKEQNI